MIRRIVALVFMAVFIASCGSSRRAGKIVTKNTEAVSIIKKHYAEEADYKTASGKLRAVYQDDEKTQSVNLSFRMEKDKAIWMSASILGFPVAKVYITPNSVSYYEKVTQSYFDGDFCFLKPAPVAEPLLSKCDYPARTFFSYQQLLLPERIETLLEIA